MMPRNSLPPGARRTPPHLSLGPLYEGCVIALAILLVALTICRWQSDLFRARAQLTITRKSIDSQWPPQKTCERIFNRAVGAMIANKQATEPLTETSLVSDQLAADQGDRSIEVLMDDDSTPLFLNFSIFCTAEQPNVAIHTVNKLAGQLMRGDAIDSTEAFVPARIRWHMVPAKNATRHSAPLALGMLGACLLVSLSVSAPLLIWRHRSAVIRDRNDAESLLCVSVLAQLATPISYGLGGKPKAVFRFISSTGEWILITMLLAALAAALLDTQFAHQLLGQPVTALADGIRQLSELTWS